jgi:hypothetical protein
MSGQRHPDTETLASLRAGLVGGLRGRRLAAHVARCARCAATAGELSTVSSFLASVPTPPLPENFEQRITAALAAEAAARATTASEPAGTASGPAVLSQSGADPGISGAHAADKVPADRRPAAPPRRRRPAFQFRPAMAFVPLVVCLLAGFGYLLSTVGGSSNSSSSPAAASSASASGPGSVAGPEAAPAVGGSASFLVTASGMNYLRSTLGTQVRLEMSVQFSTSAGQQSMAPSASGNVLHSASTAGSAAGLPAGFAAPSRALSGCVLRVTGGVRPTLVDKATYQGEPVYVIAVPTRAWVVARGCTASHPALITSVTLTGAR